MPAKAGIQNYLKILDSRLRGNDVKGRFKTFYETINIKFGKTRVSDARKVSLNAVKVYIYLASFLTKLVISHSASHIHFS